MFSDFTYQQYSQTHDSMIVDGGGGYLPLIMLWAGVPSAHNVMGWSTFYS